LRRPEHAETDVIRSGELQAGLDELDEDIRRIQRAALGVGIRRSGRTGAEVTGHLPSDTRNVPGRTPAD
jgi:hypothetical protein